MSDGILYPGTFVRHPGEPDWGLGQVQSVIAHRVTVNFEHRGKITIDIRHVTLQPVFDIPGDHGPANTTGTCKQAQPAGPRG